MAYIDPSADLAVVQPEDWEKFSYNLIVDPMVFRSADLFLAGSSGAIKLGMKPDELWTALGRNMGSPVAFFDAIILSERLPIIDYEYTFGYNLGFDPNALVNRSNQGNDKVLDKVHVSGRAYYQSRDAAIDALNKWRTERGRAPDSLIREAKEEMSAFQYNWQPDLPGLGPVDSEEKTLMNFMFSETLFGAYAQATGSGHLLQPNRARLYLAASIGTAGDEDEKELFTELKHIIDKAAGPDQNLFDEKVGLPAFLPLLLQLDPKTPAELLAKALEFRKTDEVAEYRKWRTRLINDWRNKGIIAMKDEAEISRITRSVVRKLGGEGELGATISLGISGIDIGMDLGRLWGWVLRELPGRRYSKLLMRMMLADHEYHRLDHHIHTLWNQISFQENAIADSSTSRQWR